MTRNQHLKRLNALQKGERHPRYKHIRLDRRVWEYFFKTDPDFTTM